jgi:succinyl-CoA synthetase beta subunit
MMTLYTGSDMNLHEFQARQLLADYALPVPLGKVAHSLEEALAVAQELGGLDWIVKAQIHAGGRGKAGGVKRVEGLAELGKGVSGLLGAQLVTAQTPRAGLPVNAVLVVRPCAIARELYLAVTVDRYREAVVFVASAVGGMDIEELAAANPESIITVAIEPVAGVTAQQSDQLGRALELTSQQTAQFGRMMQALYRLFMEKDASLIEINPLVVTEQGDLVALDAKIQVDDNALARHADISALRDLTQEDVRENSARQYGLNYITLDGNIACMVNGAGLAMATMDLIKLHGGEPANFLDVGGGTSAEKVAQALKLILSDIKVRVILVNIFGGIVRCDLIAEGIIQAAAETGIRIPIIARLEGTNVERARKLLHESGLAIVSAIDLTDAAKKAVASVG